MNIDHLTQLLEAEMPGDPAEQAEWLNAVRRFLHAHGPHADMPVDLVQWVPLDQVEANDYNPNSVATNEMRLLYVSIAHDGYTQPVVTVWNPEKQKYVIVDGFHRTTVLRQYPDLRERTGGLLPIVVLDKTINDRMASTVRHNRARGKHSIAGMATIVFSMLENGWDDAAICNEMGIEPDELLRLKHVTGFSKLFENTDYRRAWETERQAKLRIQYMKDHPDERPAAN
jgi:hypothetical protein